MSQERWDIVLHFLTGPLALREDVVAQGPVVRIGADPGPDGLRLDGYRGIDVRQATITTYNGQPQIQPVGQAQVRVAPHENVDWNEVLPIRGPVHLSPGSAFHLGPPGRGATAVVVECRRLGTWQQRSVMSDASQAEGGRAAPTDVHDIDTAAGIPWWIIPGFLGGLMMLFGGLGVIVLIALQIQVDKLGPVDDGLESYGCRGTELCEATLVEKVDISLYEGMDRAFFAFVMGPNVKAAEWPELEKAEKWDRKLIEYTTRAAQIHARGWAYWRQLDGAKESYATVVAQLRKAGLPDVLAAIPMQESRYNANAHDSMLCARGYWQFQPETALRANIAVRDCRFKDTDVLWTPKALAPPIKVIKNAEYVSNGKCRIVSSGCNVDQRSDLRVATEGAIQLLKEAFEDPELRFSGALTQVVIATHNSGFDDSRYRDDKRANKYNQRWAYREYLQDKKLERAPDYVGQNITCEKPGDAKDFSDRCGGKLGAVTQQYVPYVIAQHLLAVCYYGTHYADEFEAFQEYREHVRGTGYCTSMFQIPTPDQIKKRQGATK